MFKIVKRVFYNHRLPTRVKKTAKHLSEGQICLFPSQGVYTLIVDGNNLEVVERLRRAKGRDLSKREGLISPPEKLFEVVDFDLLKEINKEISRNTIKELYTANPVGLVLPCKETAVPSHLITYQEIDGKKIPTIMNIWNSKYKIYDLLWKEVSKYPKVLWVGSSANLTNQQPLNYKDTCRVFSKAITFALQDPDLEIHPFQGSYTMISLIENPPRVLRKGSIHPEKHPIDFQRFKDILPNLVVP